MAGASEAPRKISQPRRSSIVERHSQHSTEEDGDDWERVSVSGTSVAGSTSEVDEMLDDMSLRAFGGDDGWAVVGGGPASETEGGWDRLAELEVTTHPHSRPSLQEMLCAGPFAGSRRNRRTQARRQMTHALPPPISEGCSGTPAASMGS